MGYDLIAKKKETEDFSIGAFTWPIMLQETGMGYLLGYGKNVEPSSYVYQEGGKGSPVSNDGYTVSSFEAKAMAKMARGFISVKRFINSRYDKMSEVDKEMHKTYKSYNPDDGTSKKLYEQPISEEYLLKLEKFADFAEKCGGFSIH